MANGRKRLEILEALTAHLETITVDNGYTHDLANRVFRGRNLMGDEVRTPDPLISLLESPTPEPSLYTGEWSDMRYDTWTLLVQGVLPDDTKNPTDPAYRLVDDVEVCLSRLIATRAQTGKPLYPNEHLLGGRITSLDIAPPVCRPPEEGVSRSTFFFMPIRLGLAGRIGIPYDSLSPSSSEGGS